MILVTGAKGQLGADVVLELERRKQSYVAVDVNEMDITGKTSVDSFLCLHKPKYVIHCAAYTAVDAAEDDEEKCNRININGAEYLAKACQNIDADLLYVSTDYVFDGQGDAPYESDSPTSPLSVYGRSKLAGEKAVMQNLERHYILRTSWLYGENGSNFVKTMLKLADTRDTINVVDDQFGSPTYTIDLAVLICDIILSEKYGIYHASNEGYCSWAMFAKEIMRLSGSNCIINPIASEQYPTRAIRPKNSRLSKSSLDNSGFSRLPTWQNAIKRFLERGNPIEIN